VGTVGRAMLTSAACCLYCSTISTLQQNLEARPSLTFNPIHRIVPTSDMSRGERIRSMMAHWPVTWPGDRTEDPEKTSTDTSWPLRRAMPTSTLSS
jgi:hypothetical protein